MIIFLLNIIFSFDVNKFIHCINNRLYDTRHIFQRRDFLENFFLSYIYDLNGRNNRLKNFDINKHCFPIDCYEIGEKFFEIKNLKTDATNSLYFLCNSNRKITSYNIFKKYYNNVKYIEISYDFITNYKISGYFLSTIGENFIFFKGYYFKIDFNEKKLIILDNFKEIKKEEVYLNGLFLGLIE